jgi:hypothetical protein
MKNLKRSILAVAGTAAAFAALAPSAFAGVVDYQSTATFSIPDGTDNGGIPSQVNVPKGRTNVQKIELVNIKPVYSTGGGGFELFFYGNKPATAGVSVLSSNCPTIPNTTSVTLSDANTTPAQQVTCPQLANGQLQPTSPLSAFAGGPSAGTWTVGVRDIGLIAGGGSWGGWTLRLTHAAPKITGTATKQKLAKTLSLSVTPDANGKVTVGGAAKPGAATAVVQNQPATIPFSLTGKAKKRIKRKGKGTVQVAVTLNDETKGTATVTVPVKVKK